MWTNKSHFHPGDLDFALDHDFAVCVAKVTNRLVAQRSFAPASLWARD
jgi:hypothetical protein